LKKKKLINDEVTNLKEDVIFWRVKYVFGFSSFS